MMKPRSARLTAIAESTTIASTSSSTLPELSAFSPSSSTATLAHLADGGALRGSVDRRAVIGQKDELRPVPTAEPDPVAMGEPMLGDRLAVDEGAVARPPIAKAETVDGGGDLGVDARHVAVRQVQVALDTPPDGERVPVHGNDPSAALVIDVESG